MSRLTREAQAAVWAAAALAIWPAGASAAPPSNDKCGGVQDLALGSVVDGSTGEADDDYQAGNGTVPSGGPDVVYKVTVPANSTAVVQAQAPFSTSLYASNECGAPPAYWNAGHALRVNNGSEGRQVWFVTVDSAGSGEKGPLKVSAHLESTGQSIPDNGIVGSVLAAIDAARRSIADSIEQARADLAGRINKVAADVGQLASSVGRLAGRTNNYRHWTFAAGSTRSGYEQTLTLFAPDSAVTVQASFYIKGSPPKKKTELVRPRTPVFMNVNKIVGKGKDVATTITASGRVYVERTLWHKGVIVDISSGEHD